MVSHLAMLSGRKAGPAWHAILNVTAMGTPRTRREFGRLAALGLGAAPLGQLLRGAAPPNAQRLSILFRTDPEFIARVFPPPLQAPPEGEMLLQYASLDPAEPASNRADPGPLVTCALYAAAQFDDRPGHLLLAMWTPNEWLRIEGREHLGQNAKQGVVALERDGQVVRASLRRRGASLHRVEAALGREIPSSEKPPFPPAHFVYRYRLNSDWAQGPLDDKEVELRRVGAPIQQEGAGAEDGAFWGCDPEAMSFQWAQASVLDPVAEFPVVEILQAVYWERAAATLSDAGQGPQRQSVFVSGVAKSEFAPSAMLNYDRPLTNGGPWMPAGWRESSTALKLSNAELDSYRSREEMRLGPLDLIDLRLIADMEGSSLQLPSACKVDANPVLRIIGLRVERSDFSPEPYSEAWLFVRCVIGQQSCWYALSHIAGEDGDLILGRETFGYPTKAGDIRVGVSPRDFALQGRRLGREFVYAEGAVARLGTAMSLSSIAVVGLKAAPFGEQTAAGELIWQPWHYQGTYYLLDGASVRVELPEENGAGRNYRTDPWFEFKPFRVLSASVMVEGAMQRGPGQVVGHAPDVGPSYLERCDGLLPASSNWETTAPPTFLATKPDSLRS